MYPFPFMYSGYNTPFNISPDQPVAFDNAMSMLQLIGDLNSRIENLEKVYKIELEKQSWLENGERLLSYTDDVDYYKSLDNMNERLKKMEENK